MWSKDNLLLLTPEVQNIPSNALIITQVRKQGTLEAKIHNIRYFVFVYGILLSEFQPNNSQHVHNKTLLYLYWIYLWIGAEYCTAYFWVVSGFFWVFFTDLDISKQYLSHILFCYQYLCVIRHVNSRHNVFNVFFWEWPNNVVNTCSAPHKKPLTKLMRAYQLDPWMRISVKFLSQYKHFHSIKCISLCRLLNGHFCLGFNVLNKRHQNRSSTPHAIISVITWILWRLKSQLHCLFN